MNTETITIEIIAHGGELSGGKSHDPGAYLISPSFRGVGRGKVSILVVVNYGTSAHTSSDKLQNVTGSISASRRFFLLVPRVEVKPGCLVVSEKTWLVNLFLRRQFVEFVVKYRSTGTLRAIQTSIFRQSTAYTTKVSRIKKGLKMIPRHVACASLNNSQYGTTNSK